MLTGLNRGPSAKTARLNLSVEHHSSVDAFYYIVLWYAIHNIVLSLCPKITLSLTTVYTRLYALEVLQLDFIWCLLGFTRGAVELAKW